ncbi:MAG: hypothetical protein ACLGGV_07340 [Bacteroidia bacterium]
MKQILFTLFSLLTINIFSQGVYDDLKVLYVGEEYEKCYKKCLKYLEDEEAAKHPLPYLFFSMANYKISQQDKFKDDYPNAEKDAISYAGKFVKKDKLGDYKGYELKLRYFEELKAYLAEQIENYFTDGDEKGFKKASGLLSKIQTFDPNDKSAMLLEGVCEIRVNNKTEGKKLLSDGLKLIKTVGVDVQFEDMDAATQSLYRFALIKYTEFQIESDNRDGAKETISLGHQYFYEKNDAYKKEYNQDYKELYDKLNL